MGFMINSIKKAVGGLKKPVAKTAIVGPTTPKKVGNSVGARLGAAVLAKKAAKSAVATKAAGAIGKAMSNPSSAVKAKIAARKTSPMIK